MPPATRRSAHGATGRVERLWDVCQVPDYRKIAPAMHAELAVTLYGFLMRRVNPDDWFSSQVAQADRTDGDIDTLSNRIAHVRTWTFVANRPIGWPIPNIGKLYARVEDKLSDACTSVSPSAFVDRRTSVLMRRLRENTTLETEIRKTGEVVVEGHVDRPARRLQLSRRHRAGGSDAKALQAPRAARSAARSTRAPPAVAGAGARFVLASDGTLRWTGARSASSSGDDVLRPRVRVIADEQLTGAPRERCRRGSICGSRPISSDARAAVRAAAAEDVTGIAAASRSS
jgi:ATP-dependent RNA helicase SUPV3L1/SUV3